MDWNTWRDKLHQTAVDHGFYEKPVPFEQTIALIHSELSEALEEMRAGNPALYCCARDTNAACKEADGCWANTHAGVECLKEFASSGRKAEGFLSEISDAIIRILDYCGYSGTDANPAIPTTVSDDAPNLDMILLTETHAQISGAWNCKANEIARSRCLQRALGLCVKLIERSGEDVEALITIKDSYNKTRAHKHGKAF